MKDQDELFSIEDIQLKTFLTYQEEINNGFENGVYWFKIILPPEERSVLEISFPHSNNATLYHQKEIIEPLKNTRYISFPLTSFENETTYFLKVNCYKEGFIPLKIFKEEAYYIQERDDLMKIGFYYGIVFAVVLFHLFHFVNSKKRTYLYYAFMLISLTLTIGYRDGFTYLFLGSGWIHDHIEPFFNLMVLISLALLTKEYMQLENYPKYLKIWKRVNLLLVIPLITNLIFVFTGSYTHFVLTENILILMISFYVLGFGIPLFKKNIYARFFLFAYTPMLVMSWYFYNYTFFGFDFIRLTISEFRISGIIEMVVFTFAITYQAKVLKIELAKLKVDIETKNRELTTFTLQMIEKNELLSEVRDQFLSYSNQGVEKPSMAVRNAGRMIEQSLHQKEGWKEFKMRFEAVNAGFYDNLYKIAPDLTNAEIKLAALMKLNLSSKEAAALLNITERSVVSARSRLRKKLNLKTDQTLFDFLARV